MSSRKDKEKMILKMKFYSNKKIKASSRNSRNARSHLLMIQKYF